MVVGVEWGILSVFHRYKNFLPNLGSDKSGGSIHRAGVVFSSPDASVVVVEGNYWVVFSITLLSWDQEAF